MSISPEQMQKYGNAIINAPYSFATSMPQNPHWYTLKKQWKDKTLFDETLLAVRAYGYTEWFGGWAYQTFNVNDRKYWTMWGEIDGGNKNTTVILNMKPRDPSEEAYDEIATDYDLAFVDEESKREEKFVMNIIGDIKGKSVLDIGCGTGLLMDYMDKPESYVGIDPSGAMLRMFENKHKVSEWGKLIQCNFEEYAGPKVDLAVCLFGSAFYIPREFIEGIHNYVKPGGRFVIMSADESYTPVTYDRLNFHQDFTTGLYDLPGEITKINNYYVHDGVVE